MKKIALGRVMRLSLTVSGAALAVGALSTLGAAPAAAEECLLDTNNNGVSDAGDTDGGATSVASSIACGAGANAGASFDTAFGRAASATGGNSTAPTCAGDGGTG